MPLSIFSHPPRPHWPPLRPGAPCESQPPVIPFSSCSNVHQLHGPANISFTKEQMQADLHLNDKQYGFAAGIFFLGYVLFEVPSNIAMQRFAPGDGWRAIIISWGIVAATMALARGWWLHSRCCDCSLESPTAGFSPGVLLYLNLLVPARERCAGLWAFPHVYCAGRVVDRRSRLPC